MDQKNFFSWTVSVIMSLLIGACVVVGWLVEPKIGATILAILLLVTVAFFYFNPKYRYIRLAGLAMTGWLSTHAVPFLSLELETKESIFRFVFGGTIHWSFDVAAGTIIVTLLLLDYFLRDGSKFLHSFFENLNFNFLSSGNPRIVRQGNESKYFENYYDHSGTDFDLEIDQAKTALKSFKPDLVIHRLGSLEDKYLDVLKPRQKFRMYSNLGRAYVQKRDQSKANFYFFKAFDHQPTDEIAKCQKAIALSESDEPAALVFAENILESHPLSEIATALVIRFKESDQSSVEQESRLPSALKDSPAVIQALHGRAMQDADLEHAERLCRRLVNHDQANHESQLLLAQTLTGILIADSKGIIELSASNKIKTRNDAAQIIDNILAARNLPCQEIAADARLLRASTPSTFSDSASVESDFRDSLAALPKNWHGRYQFALFLLRNEKTGEAIYQLRKVLEISEEFGPMLMLARTLCERNDSDSLAESKAILDRIQLTELDSNGIFDFGEVKCKLIAKQQNIEEALKFACSSDSVFGAATAKYFEAMLHKSNDQIELATNSAVDAKNLLDEQTSTFAKSYLAHLLFDLNKHDDALSILKSIAKPSSNVQLSELVVECCLAAKDYIFLFSFCKALRSRGFATHFSIDAELCALELHSEFAEVLAIIDEALVEDFDKEFHAYLLVKQSAIGIRLNRPELVNNNTERFPKAENAKPRVGCTVASVLCHSKKYEEASAYIYALLRNNFDNPEVHACCITLFGIGDESIFQHETPESVEPGCAVRFISKSKSKWFVIEDEFDAKNMLGELDPHSPTAKELMGKKIGDEFYIRKDGIQDRKGKIELILHKHEFRRQDCFLEFEERFPDRNFSRSYELPKNKDGEVDVEAFKSILEKFNLPRQKLDEIAEDQLITLTVYSKHSGLNVIQSLVHLGANPRVPIRCCRGNDSDFEQANEVLSDENKLIIDASAVATLFVLDFHKAMRRLPMDVFIAESTLHLFRKVVQNPSELFARKRGSVIDGQLIVNEFSETQLEHAKANYAQFVDWLESNTSAVGGKSLAELKKENRDTYLELFGNEAAQTLAIAKKMKFAIWTDDFAISEIAKLELSVRRVWSDVVFENLANQQSGIKHELKKLKLILADYGFVFVRLRPNEILDCLDSANYQVDRFPLRGLITWLGISGCKAPYATIAATFLICRVWASNRLTETAQQVTTKVVESICSRTDAFQILQSLGNQIATAFRFDPFAFEFCISTIRQKMDAISAETLIKRDDLNY